METQVEDNDGKKSEEMKEKMKSNPFFEQKFKTFYEKNREVLEMPTPKSFNRSDCLDFKPKTLKEMRFQDNVSLKRNFKKKVAELKSEEH